MIKLKDLIIEGWNSNIWKSNIWKSDLWKSDIWNSHIWENENVTVKHVSKEHEKLARFFISKVWSYMPKNDDRYSPYEFSMWMDNDEPLQKIKQQLVDRIYPNDDDGYEKLFHDIITPTLEKLEHQHYDKRAEKLDKNDPLAILKMVVKGKSYEGSKQSLIHSNLMSWSHNAGRVKDETAEAIFHRLYRLSMGETMYEIGEEKLPRVSDLRNPSPTNDTSESTYVQHYAGYKAEKFPDKVIVFRGVNSPHHSIRPGDYVSFDKDYAQTYMRGKFGATLKNILLAKDLKVADFNIHSTKLIYWPEGHQIKKFTGNIPSFKEFWAMYR